ncbi:hypothetical protein BJV82DRAFT_666447 [Fennellomyces sp. T-0311]|nr:hypothetical protein BJV82DRAFT_666447 [Fennellomyces sp. T-0311]
MRGSILASALLLLSIVRFNEAAAFRKRAEGVNATDSSGHNRPWKRQDGNDITICPMSSKEDETYLSSIYNHFGYIAFNGAELFGYGYELPIAVHGDLILNPAARYIGQKYPSTCIADDPYHVDSFAFIHEGGTIEYGFLTPFDAYGNVILQDTMTDKVVPVGENCQKYPVYRNPVSIPYTHEGVLMASKYLADLPPDLHLEADGHITSLGSQANDAYQVITLNTCNPPAAGDTTCSSLPLSQLSDPAGILFFSESNEPSAPTWPGPDDPSLYKNAQTVVINIPITNGETKIITTNNPHKGFDSCKLIFNFYSVDADGNYNDDSDTNTFKISYLGVTYWQGFIIAPRGTIDASAAVINGKIFANSILNEDKSGLYDFNCGTYSGCFPVMDNTPTTTIPTTTRSPFTTSAISTSYTTVHTITTTTEKTTSTHQSTLTKTTSSPETFFDTTYVEITKVATVPTTAVVSTTTNVFIPVDNSWDEEEKDKKWGDKGEKWSHGKEDKWSYDKEGKGSDSGDKWSGKGDGW